MSGKINREIDNYLTIVHDLASRATVWQSKPAWIEFTTNNVCNLRCVMCGQSDGERPMKMEDAKAEQLLDEVLEHASLLSPMANSEPMLGNIKLILEKAREHDTYLNIITNATIMNGERFRAMADRIFKISLSMDSHIKEVFERVRPGSRFELVDKNVREIVPVAAELRVPLAFNFVFMSANAEHLAGFVDYVADVGGAEVPAEIRVQPMLYNAKGCEGMSPHERYSTEELESFIDQACARAEEHHIILDVDLPGRLRRNVTPVPPLIRGIMPDLLTRSIQHIRERYPQFCHMASYYMKIDPDGTVFPCCRAPSELIMGNVHESSATEIWNNEKYQAFRKRMHDQDYPEACRSCDMLVDNPNFVAPKSKLES